MHGMPARGFEIQTQCFVLTTLRKYLNPVTTVSKMLTTSARKYMRRDMSDARPRAWRGKSTTGLPCETPLDIHVTQCRHRQPKTFAALRDAGKAAQSNVHT